MKKKLGDVFEIGSGGTPSKTHPEYYGGDIPWVKTGDLKSEYLYEVEDFITEEGLNNSSAKMYESDTVLIAMYGATIGATSILNFPACTNQACAAFKKSEEILPEYLYFFLRSKKEKFVNDGVGGTQPNISAGYLKKVQIEVRSLDEQSEIINVLDKVNRIIDERTKELAALDDLIKARFVELFGLPLDKSKANMRFTDCVEFNPKKSEVKDMQDVEVSFVPMECVGVDGSFNIRENGPVSNYYKGYTYFRDGDVLLAKITPCFENGKAAIAEGCMNGIGFGTTEFHVARPKAGVSNSYWIKYMLKNDSVHELATINMTGSAGQKRIQTPFFDKLTIYCPPIELQNQFADFVNQVNKSKLVIKNLLQIYKHQIQM